MKDLNTHFGYSTIVALFITGFLLVLSTGVFNLILNELKDNNAMGNYIKAYAGAESAQELALLQIKKNGYAYYDKIDHDINNRSIILSSNPLDISRFKYNKDIFISYDINSKTSEYNGTLSSLEYDIIPLFYVNDLGEQNVLNINLSIIFGSASDLSWNIIGKDNGISGKGSSNIGFKKTLTTSGFKYTSEDINTFINSSDSNYLVLLNTGDNGLIKYKLESINNGEYFTKPKTSIISSAEIGGYKQNLSTDLDNTKFLNMLKYSIYSN